MGGRRWLGPALAAALWLLAIALRWPILDAPPYGDEGLHWWTARHLGHRLDVVEDLWGHDLGGAPHLVLQRPLFYVALALPAQAGFQAFRAAASLGAALLAPAGYAALRAHGIRRPAAVAAGIGLAAVPPLVSWGNFALMDGWMAAFLLGVLWARGARRPAAAFAFAVAAAWTKETALLFLAALLAADVAVALRRRTGSLWPLRLDAQASALAFSLLVGVVPVAAFVASDFARIGAVGAHGTAAVADQVLLSPWLALPLAAGLARPRSRTLCACAFGAAAVLLALHGLGRSVEGWYMMPTAAFALVGSAAAADAWLRDPPRWRPLAFGPAAVAVAVVAVLALAPAGLARDAASPLSGEGGQSLAATWRFESEVRDRDYLRAQAAIPAAAGDGSAPDVFAIDVYPPRLIVPFAHRAGDLLMDWTPLHDEFAFGADQVGARIEANGTWTLVEVHDTVLNAAIRDVYGDCRVLADGGYEVLEGWRCRGRADELVAAWQARTAPAA